MNCNYKHEVEGIQPHGEVSSMVADIKELKETVASLKKENMELKVKLDEINQKVLELDKRSSIQNGVFNVAQLAASQVEQKIPEFSTPTNETDVDTDCVEEILDKKLELCGNGNTLTRFPAWSFKTP